MCGLPVDSFRMSSILTPRSAGGLRPGGRAIGRGRILVLLAAVACAGTRASAAPPCPSADVWVASTRRLPGVCRLPDRAGLEVERLSGGDRGRWQRASVEELLADSDRPLVVFVHGNRYAAGEAKSQGLQFARLVATTCPDAGPVRTVVFSWPSDKQGVLLRDVRAKYGRAHADGHYLAWLLGRVDPERPVALVGFSFGALVSLQALKDLEAAAAAGVPWPERPGRTNLVFVAPAVRCDALSPRGPFRTGVEGVDGLTLVANSADCALAFFPSVNRGDRAEALGSTAMPRRWLPMEMEYSAVDAADVVGVQHSLPPYFASGTLARRIAAGTVAGFATPAGRRE